MPVQPVVKVQFVLHDVDNWRYYLVADDGQIYFSSRSFPTEEAVRAEARQSHPDLDFVFPGSRTHPQEVWPPQP